MGKYDELKYWAVMKARVPHRCYKCGAEISKAELYYKERIDFVDAPGLLLREMCFKCGKLQEAGSG